MRVLLVVHGFPPSAQGGTEIYVHQLAQALRKECGDEVAVFTREADLGLPEGAVRSETLDGIEVRRVNNTFRDCRRFEQTYRNPGIRGLAAHAIDEFRPDVIHVHHLTCLSTDLVDEFADRRIPTIVTLNDYWLMCQRGQLLDRDYRRCPGPWPEGCAHCLHATPREAEERRRHVLALCNRVTRFLAPSRTARDRFAAFGVEPDRMTLEEQGIDHRPFQGPERLPSDRLRLGFVGSLMVSKAPHLLIEAFAGLPPGAASVHLSGAYLPYHGDDGYRRTLDPLLVLPGVYHAGPLPHQRIPEALFSIDVLVVPSVWLENSPFVVSEAFVAGLPVVASDLGGMAEKVAHERNGLLFRPGDAADLRRCLARLIDEPGLLDRLRTGIPRVPTIEENARWVRSVYVACRSGPKSAMVS